jgi:hypothetical protein
MNEYLQLMSDIAGIVAVAIALFAFVFSLQTRKQTKKTEQYILTGKNVDDILQMRHEFKELQEEAEAEDQELYKLHKSLWLNHFFNKNEWLSLLVNEGEIKNEKLIDYISDMIKTNYEDFFQKHATKEEIENPNVYSELKKLYKRVSNKT